MRAFSTIGICLLATAPALARPSGPAAFCDVYPDSSTCAGRGTTCVTCHTSTSPQAPAWNTYGEAVLGNLSADFDAEGALATALHAIEQNDDDGDGLTNLEEILLGTLPGDASSSYRAPPVGSGEPNPGYDIGVWDAEFALRRLMVAYCGRSPLFVAIEALNDTVDRRAYVHSVLDDCLASDYWKRIGVMRLADERVRPLDLGTSWQWDYRLWRYALTDDHDVRDVLLATYHVREPEPGELVQVTDVIEDLNACSTEDDCAFDHVCGLDGDSLCHLRDGMQPLVAAERAGMIGTAWFHAINTMFSSMPRTTAAQAMRGFLGMDLARQQGIDPIENEPLDVDAKGVAGVECAQCHATLDPATYPFAKYRGIEPQGASVFDPNRPIEKGLWTAGNEPQGMLLGEPVDTLKDWAEVAASSDAFLMNMTRILFEHAIGRPPGPQDKAEVDALWPSWSSADIAYSSNRFIHALVDTNAFGAP